MSKPDYVKLFATGGSARQYFLDAANNAPWVDSFLDGLVAELSASPRYLAELDKRADLKGVGFFRHSGLADNIGAPWAARLIGSGPEAVATGETLCAAFAALLCAR